ncbi:MAG TPA: hypothetical protein PKZ38_04900 [Dermatophilaceae bacterium]|jgi:hypothetical protein|nr:hypothetical protein [Dermatophilaceae bacterium]
MSDFTHDLPQPPEPSPASGAPVETSSSATIASPVDMVTPPRKRRTALIAGLVALVIVGGTAALAMTKLRPSGTQPDVIIPASAVAYVRVDLDPSAGQKLSAVRFMSKLPKSAADFGTDPRKALIEELRNSATDPQLKTALADAESWLGNRAAASAFVTADGTPVPFGAVEVTDEAKAKAAFASMSATSGSGDTEVTIRSGYALFTEKGKGATLTAEIDKGTIATNATYAEDMAALGDQGVASAWVDVAKGLDALAKSGLMPGGSVTDLQSQIGGLNKGMRFATAVRFDPDYVELAGVFRGDGRGEVAIAAPPGLGQLTSLPDDTLMGVQINGYDKGLEKGWPDFAKSFESAADVTIADLERGLGLRLPDDLINILGSTLTVALPDQRFGSDGPTFGVITTPKDVAEAERALGSALEALEAPLSMSVDGPKLVVASDEAYATRLKAGGTLGSVDGFATAVGDPSKAMYGFFINLDLFEKSYADSFPAQWKDFVLALKSVGGSSTMSATQGTFQFRLLSN